MKTRILIPQRRIQRRVRELARAIDRHYRGKEITVIAVLSGGVIFAADLVRRLKTPLRMDFIRASSYGAGRRSSGRVALHSGNTESRRSDSESFPMVNQLPLGQPRHN